VAIGRLMGTTHGDDGGLEFPVCRYLIFFAKMVRVAILLLREASKAVFP